MTQAMGAAGVEKSIVEGVLEALSDKHAQLDLNLQGMSIRLPNLGMSMEFNGTVTVTAHFRDLTADEKKASAAKNVTMMSKA
jgi:hypothetical protein